MPSLYSYSIENINKKINDLIELGYSKKEVLYLLYELPALFGLTLENIKNKVEFLKDIGLGDIIIKKPKYLIQSIDLTYARYHYLISKNIVITPEKYSLLFKGETAFEKQYGVKKQELIEKYNYKKYIEEKTKNGRII